MDFSSNLIIKYGPSLGFLFGLTIIAVPFLPALLLHLFFGSDGEGTPNEVLWKRERRGLLDERSKISISEDDCKAFGRSTALNAGLSKLT